MGRPIRTDPADGWHHVMNRGAAGRPIFHGDVDRIELERLLGTVHERFGVQVHASCFMGNHFHLLLRCPDGGLSPSMQVVASSFTRFVNDRAGTDGPIFRGRFRSLPIVDEHQLLHVMRYIHRNPLEFVPSAALAAYRWSSFGAYLERRVSPPWLVTDELLGRFSEGRNGLARFVLEPLHDVPPEHIRRIASLVVDELDDDVGARQGLVTTIASVIVGDDRDAARRARRRVARDPRLADVVERVRHLAA